MEWKAEHQKEADEYAKKHNLVTVQDHINHIKKKLANSSMLANGKKNSAQEKSAKKKCLNCGGTKLVRQYDETKTTQKDVVWTNEYLCLACKERFNA